MKQNKKIILETIEQQQKRILDKLLKEKESLELALEDKIEQIELQKQVLNKIVNK